MAIFTDHQANTLGILDGSTTTTSVDPDLVTFTDGQLGIAGTLNATNFKVGGAQGTDGQVLTSTGSGVGWADASGDAGGGGGGGSMTLISTQNVGAVSSIDFTSIGSYTRWKMIGTFTNASRLLSSLKLYNNGNLISNSDNAYSSYRTALGSNINTYNGSAGFITYLALTKGFFIIDIAIDGGRPYVKMDFSGTEYTSHTTQTQNNTIGTLVDSYSFTSLTGFRFSPLGSFAGCRMSLYGIETS